MPKLETIIDTWIDKQIADKTQVAASSAAETLVEDIAENTKAKVKYEMQVVKDKVDDKAEEMVNGKNGKWLTLAGFAMSAASLILAFLTYRKTGGIAEGSSQPTIINVYYDKH